MAQLIKNKINTADRTCACMLSCVGSLQSNLRLLHLLYQQADSLPLGHLESPTKKAASLNNTHRLVFL